MSVALSVAAPAEIDPRRHFRNVLGHLPTGVAVVTANGPDGPVGMAVNSITSVSLDPPLISVCVARTSSTWPRIRSAGRFCISILADHHEQTSRRFAGPDRDRFTGVPLREQAGGPVLEDAVAWLDCDVYAEFGAGDHTIVVARVLDLGSVDDGRALVFFRGSYGRFAPHDQV
ncbi:flavin reductase [Aeromicrobium sp. SMF47]|uniref:flavin reductase family protein n=1 Tax=Aeromicrobium yanjiei TaxID=2662028 RepID=UPI00129E6E83|nr:flavin reductase family protein [Aeromicrobium yanjiei]MRJ76107.1 flavin reductase [Aeromicrobium yanjiei]